MLIKYVEFLVFMFINVSWASSSSSYCGEENDVKISKVCQNLIEELLNKLESSSHATAGCVGRELRCAAEGGHIVDVQNILEIRPDNISADDVGIALLNAVKGGHTLIVKLLLQSRTDICADDIGIALSEAIKYRHTLIFELLLQSPTYIPAYEVDTLF
jgi:hypothetical protein